MGRVCKPKEEGRLWAVHEFQALLQRAEEAGICPEDLLPPMLQSVLFISANRCTHEEDS